MYSGVWVRSIRWPFTAACAAHFVERVRVFKLAPSRVSEHQWLETDELLDVSFTGVVSDCRVRASSEVRASNFLKTDEL